MPTSCDQRFFGEEKENRIKYPFKGEVRFLQVCLDYEGEEALTCTVDGANLRDIAIKNGVKDIVCIYDNGTTELFPTKENVAKEFIAMANRCKPGDFFVFLYSGHGTHTEDEDGDESDGQDEAFCLRNEDGETQLLIDDEISEFVSENLDPRIPCLFLVDACHSGTILDLTNKDVWDKGRRVFCISGCQDNQTSGDTGNGGIMTHALIDTLTSKSCKKRRKNRNASIQFVFNRMINKMPEEAYEGDEGMEEGMEGMEEDEDYEFNGEYDEAFDNMDFEDYEEEDEEDEKDQIDPGQFINLSWCHGTDPCKVSFPF